MRGFLKRKLPSVMLEQVAKEKNVSVKNLVKQCCEYALGDLPREENK